MISLVERFLPLRRGWRTWRTMKRPRKKSAVCTCLRVSDAVRRRTRPLPVSSVAPTGIVSAPSSRTKPFGGLAAWDARAAPAGSFTKTSPETTVALTVLKATGRAAPLLSSQPFLMPSLSASAVPQGSGRRPASARRDVHGPGLPVTLSIASVAVAVAV